MTTARFSTVLDQPVETVWSLIRDFNNYPAYIEGVTESHIEDDLGATRSARSAAFSTATPGCASGSPPTRTRSAR